MKTAASELLAPCGVCGLDLAEAEMQQLLAKEQMAEKDVNDLVSQLKSAKDDNFPLEGVLNLLGKCSEAGLTRNSSALLSSMVCRSESVLGPGLSVEHWLSFWLLSLAAVGSSGRPLLVAAHGVARSTAAGISQNSFAFGGPLVASSPIAHLPQPRFRRFCFRVMSPFEAQPRPCRPCLARAWAIGRADWLGLDLDV